MKEQLINFETAKLAKEKDFFDKNVLNETRISQPFFYTKNGEIKEIKEAFLYEKDFEIKDCFNAPTQSLLQKWLREVHNIDISLQLNQFGYGYMYAVNDIKECKNIIELKGGVNQKWNYEQALEIGLQEALKQITL